MRRGHLVVALAAFLAGGAGCRTFWHDAFRNLAETPVRGVDAYCTTVHCREEAKRAWQQVEGSLPPGEVASPDFARGFQDGFAEYLDIGGTGQPPAVPPFCYQQSKYQGVAGHEAIQAWYAGYAAGSAAARASGLRELIVIPLSAPPINVLPQGPQRPPWYPPWTRLPQREVPPRAPRASGDAEAPADLPPPRPVERESPEPSKAREKGGEDGPSGGRGEGETSRPRQPGAAPPRLPPVVAPVVPPLVPPAEEPPSR